MNANIPPRVLIIETDRDALEMMMNMLTVLHGYQTTGEQDLDDALKRTEMFDVIMVGNLRPHDRADAFRRLRNKHPRAQICDLSRQR